MLKMFSQMSAPGRPAQSLQLSNGEGKEGIRESLMCLLHDKQMGPVEEVRWQACPHLVEAYSDACPAKVCGVPL